MWNNDTNPETLNVEFDINVGQKEKLELTLLYNVHVRENPVNLQSLRSLSETLERKGAFHWIFSLYLQFLKTTIKVH